MWMVLGVAVFILAGIPVLKTYFMDDADLNALATGRDSQYAFIAFG